MSDKKCTNCGYQLNSWDDCVSIDNILECPECEEHFELKAVTLNNPQLTIPKSIAESVEKHHKDFNGRGYFEEIVWDWACEPRPTNESLDFSVERSYIIQAYLAGKALGVDLVKVVADD